MHMLPTFLELAGLKPMPQTHRDGISLLPFLSGKQSEKRSFFWHFPHRQNPSSAVMVGDWKLVHHIVEDKYELFDLKTDPWENKDLKVVYPEQFKDLKEKLEAHLQSSAAQGMRSNPEWNSTGPQREIRNFGIYYPAEGGEFQIVKQPYPNWFKGTY